MRRETEDYCDQKLAVFERLLASTKDAVSSGRRRLQETALDRERERLDSEAMTGEAGESPPHSVFFDQDLTDDR